MLPEQLYHIQNCRTQILALMLQIDEETKEVFIHRNENVYFWGNHNNALYSPSLLLQFYSGASIYLYLNSLW